MGGPSRTSARAQFGVRMNATGVKNSDASNDPLSPAIGVRRFEAGRKAIDQTTRGVACRRQIEMPMSNE